jgi:hypothetical protein
LVVLGDEEFHLEFVLGETGGRLRAYVLDAHAEQFVRVPLESIELEAVMGATKHLLRLLPVPTPATGETVGDTATFEGEAEWLRSGIEFTGRIPVIEIRGRRYLDTPIRFPAGEALP